MTRNTDMRVTGYYREYPGAHAWPIYEYRCGNCGRWGESSDVSFPNDDGTDSPCCPACEELADLTPAQRRRLESAERVALGRGKVTSDEIAADQGVQAARAAIEAERRGNQKK